MEATDPFELRVRDIEFRASGWEVEADIEVEADTDVEAFDPVRVAGFEEAKTVVIGE